MQKFKQFLIYYIYLLSQNHDLVEMVLADEGQEVWCVWVTGSGDSAVSHTNEHSGLWSWVTLEPPPPLNLPPDPTLDARQTYLDAIFKPGVFSISDIQKALSVSHLFLVLPPLHKCFLTFILLH